MREQSQTGSARRKRRAPAGNRRARWMVRLAALCLGWLALLVWPSAPLDGALRSLGTRLTSLTQPSTSWHLAQVPAALTTAVPPNPNQLYWQVGLRAGEENNHATGMRTVIQTLVPQATANQTTNYYWVGAYLADDSFIQMGYYIPWYDNTHAGWFYCAFDAHRNKGPCAYGPPGSAGVNGAAHTYTLETVPAADGKIIWRARLDTVTIGQFTWTAGDTGANTPLIYAEASGHDPHPATSQLGPVDFPIGFSVRRASESAYTPVTHALVTYSTTNACPPYGLEMDGHGGVLLGSGLSCPPNGATLW